MKSSISSIVSIFVLFSCIAYGEDDLYFVPQSMGSCSFNDDLLMWTVADFDGDENPDVAGIFFAEAYSPAGTPIGRPYLEIFGSDGFGNLTSKKFIPGDIGTRFLLPGDWDNNGIDDLLYSIHTTSNLLVYQQNEYILKTTGLSMNSSFLTVPPTGDFDGDGNLDALAGQVNQTSQNKSTMETNSIVYGDGTGKFAKRNVSCDKALDPCVADFNHDGYDDIAYGFGDSIVFRYGAAVRESVFASSDSVFVRGVTEYTHAYDADGDGNKEVYAASGDSAVLMKYNGQMEIDVIELDLPIGFNPLNARACDFNFDGVMDLFSYSGNEIYITHGLGYLKYGDLIQINTEFVKEIDRIHAIDVNRDLRPDLIVSADDRYLFTYIQHPIDEKPAPSPKPTPTPTLVPLIPTPTPTPPVVPAESNLISTQEEFNAAFDNIEPNDLYYISPMTSFYRYLFTERVIAPFTLIGIDPSNLPRIIPLFNPNTRECSIQNLLIGSGDTAPVPSVSFTDCNATIVHCTILGHAKTERGYSSGVIPGHTIMINDCLEKRIVLQECTIDAPNNYFPSPYPIPSSICISSCTDVEIVIDGCRFISEERDRNAFLIENSKNVRVRFIHQNRFDPVYDLDSILVNHSTVTIEGGLVHGWKGSAGICGGDGEPGINAINDSTVSLIEMLVTGGKGGAGIFPGEDAPAWTTDETSNVLNDSSLPNWREY